MGGGIIYRLWVSVTAFNGLRHCELNDLDKQSNAVRINNDISLSLSLSLSLSVSIYLSIYLSILCGVTTTT